MKMAWEDVRQSLMSEVFYAHSEINSEELSNLSLEALKDSLSDVTIIEILSEASGREDVLDIVKREDLRSFDSIRQFYASL